MNLKREYQCIRTKGIFVTEDTSGQTMDFALLVEFGSYPINLKDVFNELPTNWWSKKTTDKKQ